MVDICQHFHDQTQGGTVLYTEVHKSRLALMAVVSTKKWKGNNGDINYLKLISPLCTTSAWWDIVIWRDVLRRDPQGRPPSTVTHHLNTRKHYERDTNRECAHFSFFQFFLLTWCGSGAVFFLNRWNTLLSSVSCIAISSRSVSARAEYRIQSQDQSLQKHVI